MATTINGFGSGNERISTQALLQQIYTALDQGETDFELLSSGHHDIGGPLWSGDGKTLKFKVKNPGQRLGAFGLAGTQIIVDGSTPADAGWLNAGAELIIKGDSGDTTAHCAASGKIFVAGQVGARSGSLMKHDPAFPSPELWVLKNTGSFAFEFMGGGTAVICGLDCEDYSSVLGDRSCMGMVGGTIYVRGQVENLPDDVWLLDLNDDDIEFLTTGLPTFLENIEKPWYLEQLTDFSQWRKVSAKSEEERRLRKNMRRTMHEFRLDKWVDDGGIFGGLIKDDYTQIAGLVNVGENRLKIPHWKNKEFCSPCQSACPSAIPTQDRINLLRQGKHKEAIELVLNYSPFPASVCGEVCPNPCMDACTRQFIDLPISMPALGKLSLEAKSPTPEADSGKKVAVIGGGPGGLSAAWQLRLKGHAPTVIEADIEVGGKLRQVIPTDRLPANSLTTEIDRIKKLGVEIKTDTSVDAKTFKQIQKDYDAIVIASGAHTPVVIPFPGHERLVKGLEFLKQFNSGENPEIGENVIVIGAGNAGMDVCLGAYARGAKQVTAIDIQRPAAFKKEIDHFERLGGKIEWPLFTDKVDAEGLHTKDGRLIKADTIIISIGERPDLSYVPREWLDERGMADVDDCGQLTKAPGVFAIGDSVKPGLLTHAIGDGHDAADYINCYLNGDTPVAKPKPVIVPPENLSTELFRPQNRSRFNLVDPTKETNRCLSCGTCRDCNMCLEACPEGAIRRDEEADGSFAYISDDNYCIGCGICAGICPCGIWGMEQKV